MMFSATLLERLSQRGVKGLLIIRKPNIAGDVGNEWLYLA